MCRVYSKPCPPGDGHNIEQMYDEWWQIPVRVSSPYFSSPLSLGLVGHPKKEILNLPSDISTSLRALPCYFTVSVQIVKIWRIAEAYSWGDGYFILDIRDCSISPNLSHFLPELIPGRPGTTIILRKLDCGDQSKIAKTSPIILQKYWCQPEVRFIFLHLRECNFKVYTLFY